MTYSREITNKIVECWGLGFTAEETVTAIAEWKGIRIGLATVYRHRHSLTAQQIIEELMRKQMRDIAKEDNSDLRMKYRDKLLEKLIPQTVLQYSRSVERVEHVDLTPLLAKYEATVERATNRITTQNHPPE